MSKKIRPIKKDLSWFYKKIKNEKLNELLATQSTLSYRELDLLASRYAYKRVSKMLG